MIRGVPRPRAPAFGAVALVLLVLLAVPVGPARAAAGAPPGSGAPSPANGTGAVANFSEALQRLVVLAAAAGSSVLALVWARVALSWFSNDVTKKVQAKDRARDALIGTLLFVAAVTGVIGGLAQWVLTGG